MVTTGILPLQGKIPMVEPGIEPGTSWLVVISHRTHDNVNMYILSPTKNYKIFIICNNNNNNT